MDMKKTASDSCCDGESRATGKYRVESIVTVDERGQMVLPKEIRERLSIKTGDKLAVIVMDRGGTPCCITLLKTDELAATVNDYLGPMMVNGTGK
jgi:AbrB family looped-hinge helix DNA binding protein